MGTKFVILCLDQVLALKITRIVKGNQVINSFEAKMKKDLNNKHLSHICFKLRKSWNALLNKKF